MALQLPSVPTFDSEIADGTGLGPKWDRWLARFENYLLATGITNDARQRAILLHSVGPETFDKFQTISDTGTTYVAAKEKLTAYLKPKVNLEYERSVFRRIKQHKTESIDAYQTRLQAAAATCDFANKDGEIKSHIIQTTLDSKLRKKGLSEGGMTLNDILAEGRNNELCQAQSRDIERDLTGGEHTKIVHQLRKQPHPCSGCASPAPHAGDRTNCPAWGKQCSACGKVNHFARSCRSSASGKPNPGNSYKPAKPQYKQFQPKPPAFNFQSGGKKFGKGKRKNFQQAHQVLQEDPDDTDEDEPGYLFSIGIDDQCPFDSDCYDLSDFF